MKRWKKWLLYTALFFFILLIFLFILFCTLIANPFEKDYENNLLYIIPGDSDFFVYIPNLEEVWNKGKKLFPLKDLQETKGFSRFAQTREYRQLVREWQNIQKQEKASGILFLKEEYLWKIVKGEMTIATKIKDKKPLFLIALRIDFLLRIAEGASGYFLPENITKKYKVDVEKVIKSAVFSGQKVFFAFQKDIVIFSNDSDYIQDSWRLLQASTDSVWLSKTVQSCFDEQKPLMFFAKDKAITSLLDTKSDVATNLYPLLDINNIQNTVATVSLDSSIDIQIKSYLNFTNISSYHQKLYKKSSQDFAAEILPIGTYIFTKVPIDELMIGEIYKILPRNAKAEWDKRLGWLNHNYGTKDFIKERVFTYLDGEIVLVCRRIDYIREDIDVIDPYPAISFFAKTKAPQELYDSLKDIIEKEIAKTNGKVKVEEKVYGTHKFLFLNVGGFDFTGGAIQPVFGTIDEYVVFTTNISFFRLLIDVQDKIAQSWDKSELHKMKEESLSSGAIQVTISGEGILTFIEDFKLSWAEAIALSRFNKNPRGRDMEYHKQKILREWQLYLDYADSIDIDILLGIQPTIEFIEINSSIFIDIKKK